MRSALKYLIVFIIVQSFQNSFAQTEASEPFIVDTVMMQNREVVLFSDQTWQYLEDLGFDGILSPYIEELMATDTSFKFTTHWSQDFCFTNDNNDLLKSMEDTIWLCLVDTIHPNYVIPVPGVMTSGYKYRGGRWHHGIDLDLNTGDTIRAAFSGKVRYAKYNTHGYGNLVIIRHYNGLETYYAHMSQLLVSPNQYVVAGQTIGLGGATGRAYGAHLHFECRFFDNSINPEEIFDFKKGELKDCNLLIRKDLFEHNKSYMAYRTPKPGQTYATGQYHRVRKDDSLWKISRMYGTTVSSICALNGITENTILQIGQQLKVR